MRAFVVSGYALFEKNIKNIFCRSLNINSLKSGQLIGLFISLSLHPHSDKRLAQLWAALVLKTSFFNLFSIKPI